MLNNKGSVHPGIGSKSFFKDGFTVLSIADKPLRHFIMAGLLADISKFPEYNFSKEIVQVSDLNDLRFVAKGLSGVPTSSSFHCTSVRCLRITVYYKLIDLLISLCTKLSEDTKKSWSCMQTFEKLMIVPPNESFEENQWHKDKIPEYKNIKTPYLYIKGWFNFDENAKGQEFHYIPKSNVMYNSKTKQDPTFYNVKSDYKNYEKEKINIGNIIIYDSTLTHKLPVLKNNKVQIKLFVGFLLIASNDDEKIPNLFQYEKNNVFSDFSVAKTQSFIGATSKNISPKVYPDTWLKDDKKLESISKLFRQVMRDENSGYVPQILYSLKELNEDNDYKPYTLDEKKVYSLMLLKAYMANKENKENVSLDNKNIYNEEPSCKNHGYLKWHKNSCYCDSLFEALFFYPNEYLDNHLDNHANFVEDKDSYNVFLKIRKKIRSTYENNKGFKENLRERFKEVRKYLQASKKNISEDIKTLSSNNFSSPSDYIDSLFRYFKMEGLTVIRHTTRHLEKKEDFRVEESKTHFFTLDYNLNKKNTKKISDILEKMATIKQKGNRQQKIELVLTDFFIIYIPTSKKRKLKLHPDEYLDSYVLSAVILMNDQFNHFTVFVRCKEGYMYMDGRDEEESFKVYSYDEMLADVEIYGCMYFYSKPLSKKKKDNQTTLTRYFIRTKKKKKIEKDEDSSSSSKMKDFENSYYGTTSKLSQK
jgi:hypothetical protein